MIFLKIKIKNKQTNKIKALWQKCEEINWESKTGRRLHSGAGQRSQRMLTKAGRIRAGKMGIKVRYIEEVESLGLLTNWICR